MKVVCVANQKGGVGKTALAFNLAASLALEGKQVLMIDLDALGSLTKSNGYNPENFESTIYNVMQDPKAIPESIYETSVENLSILPASLLLDSLEIQLLNKKDRYNRLKKALEVVKGVFDVVLLDCSPSLNTFTINALVASDYIIVPAETKFQSDFALDVFLSTFSTIKEVKNPDLKMLGVVATMYNCQANEDKEVLQSLQQNNILLGIVKRTTAVSSAVKKGLPCVVANKRTVVAKEYRTITTKIMNLMGV